MNHDLMTGMFWGGFVMALPPVVLGIVIAVLVIRHHRASNGGRGRAGE